MSHRLQNLLIGTPRKSTPWLIFIQMVPYIPMMHKRPDALQPANGGLLMPREAWARSLSVWVGAEYTALRREDALGLRKYPIAAQWELMLVDLSTPLVLEPDRL
ncbi:hypothetical protein NDU88_012637 [Pleurodeles waltl]|uniref:Uncharacterized protein n=1 Tax=Pleurodeles waltl TaxID=8319 RepID=A0AAV7R6P3_PLEWA|nr:hypothetical protein NDU88_012637 [Pleurodeles waltl]